MGILVYFLSRDFDTFGMQEKATKEASNGSQNEWPIAYSLDNYINI